MAAPDDDSVMTLIAERGSLADFRDRTDPTTTGWTRCNKCAQGVLLRGEESTKVAAGTWVVLCEVCAQELAAEYPEAFMHLAACPNCRAEYPVFHSPSGTLGTLCDNCGWSSDEDNDGSS